MRLLRFVPIKLTLFLISGICIGTHVRPGTAVSFGLVIVLLVIVRILRKNTPRTSIAFGLAVMLLTVSVGILSVAITDPYHQKDFYGNLAWKGDHSWKLKVLEVPKPNAFSYRYVMRAVRLDNYPVTGKLMVSVQKDSLAKPLQVDDEIAVYGKISAIKPPLNPHQFDYRAYLKTLNIHHQMHLQQQDLIPAMPSSRTIQGLAASFRERITGTLRAAHFGEAELGVVKALILGDRTDIPDSTYNDYIDAGAVHILAVSGLHVGLILVLLQFLLRPLDYLPKGRTIRLWLTVLLLWGFAFLAGLSASVIRAVTMFSFVAYAFHLNRPGNSFNILALSMFVLLLVFDPRLVYQVGFQLSYAAVCAILWIYPILQRKWHPRNRLVRYFWQLFTVGLAAQLGVLPIGLFYFHQFPGLFFLSNIVVVPLLGMVLGMGFVVICLALIGIVPTVLVTCYGTLIGMMNSLVGWIGGQEAFLFTDIPFDWVDVVLGYVLVLTFITLLEEWSAKNLGRFLMSVMVFQIGMCQNLVRTGEAHNLVVGHQPGNTVIIHQQGRRLRVFTTDSIRARQLVSDYALGERTAASNFAPIANGYRFDRGTLQVVDGSGHYLYDPEGVNVLLLTNSPRINLQRLLDSIRPTSVVADGSNYRSVAARWSETCRANGVPFHYTGDKGAYIRKLDD